MTRLARALGYAVLVLLWVGVMALMIDDGVSRNQDRWDKVTGIASPRPSGED